MKEKVREIDFFFSGNICSFVHEAGGWVIATICIYGRENNSIQRQTFFFPSASCSITIVRSRLDVEF